MSIEQKISALDRDGTIDGAVATGLLVLVARAPLHALAASERKLWVEVLHQQENEVRAKNERLVCSCSPRIPPPHDAILRRRGAILSTAKRCTALLSRIVRRRLERRNATSRSQRCGFWHYVSEPRLLSASRLSSASLSSRQQPFMADTPASHVVIARATTN